ncbi:MAG: ABC transporter permease [Burkholderiales bacterium]|nr:ABC transporter permease [Burkholderiales bacterium]
MSAARIVRRAVSPLIVLLSWELVSRSGFVNPLLLPPPSQVLRDLYGLIASTQLFSALWASMKRVLSGFAIAVVVGIAIGVLMASSKIAEDFIDPLVELLRPISPLALFPLAILWFGIGDASKVFLIALSCSFPILLNTYAGVKSVDAALIRAARSLGASRLEIIKQVILPGSIPSMLTGVRISWGIALIVIIASEMVGAVNGLGFMVLDAQQTFQTERLFSGIIVIALLGYGTDQGLRWLRKRLVPWHQEYRV